MYLYAVIKTLCGSDSHLPPAGLENVGQNF